MNASAKPRMTAVIPMSRYLFRLLAFLHRSRVFSARRFMRRLAKEAYGPKPSQRDFAWYRDSWGSEFFLHPYYYLDFQTIVFGGYERAAQLWIERNIEPGMVCLDVGANMGLMGIHMARKVGPDGAVYCFEPVPSVFRRLAMHVERNGVEEIVRLYRCALSNRTGRLGMTVADEESKNQGVGSLVGPRSGKELSEIEVETRTLDDLLAAEHLTRLDFVKVDIEGGEPLFLEGAR